VAGAAAVIIANSNANGYFRLSPDPGTAAPTLPVFSVPLSTYSLLSNAILLGSTLRMGIQPYVLPSCEFHPHFARLIVTSRVSTLRVRVHTRLWQDLLLHRRADWTLAHVGPAEGSHPYHPSPPFPYIRALMKTIYSVCWSQG
jgi:hypothetical protein